MQEFAPTKSRLSGDCPSDEELAAYIDGGLDREETAWIEKHLLSCERCDEICAETLRFQLDSEPAPEPEGKVVPFRSAGGSLPVLRWLPFAALLLVGIGGGTYSQLLAPPPELETAKVAPTLSNSLPGIQPMWLGPTTRGGGDGDEEQVKLEEASFHMGVQLVNLQASLKAGKKDEAQNVVAYILGLLKPQPVTDDLYKSYSGITAALAKKAPSEVLPEASRLARETREAFEPTPLDFGQWVEAARLAALAHDSSLFQQADTRAFLRRLLWRDKFHDLLRIEDAKLDPATRENLERIADIISKGDLRPADYDEMAKQLEDILKKYYPA